MIGWRSVGLRMMVAILAPYCRTKVGFLRCAHIIHGKGYRSGERQPVLKRKVNYWLRLRPDVLAFCSATPRDGGTGAVYVLLRNPDKARREGKR